MQATMESLGKISVGGIKLSQALAQIDVRWQTETIAQVPLLKGLAEKKINLTYLSISSDQASNKASFCVSIADIDEAKKMIDREPNLRGAVTIIAPVGALTVFPHRSSLTLLRSLMFALISAGCLIYGVASSISALTFITDYRFIDLALEALESIIDLPPHHTPYRQEFLVKQI
jgi:hypothetical protein